MLRSLVGSEMCIRDSFVSIAELRYILVNLLREEISIKDISYCLLYTSDAADEEDSVDIGGCRIFKAEDGIRDAQESRGIGDVYKRQLCFDCRIKIHSC